MSTLPEPLTIRLLGELTVEREGRVSTLPASKKSRALLAYLVATGRTHTREQLSDLLWDAPGDSRAALRWSLTKIRPLLDDRNAPRLVADREHVEFQSNGALVDLAALDADLAPGVVEATTEALRRAAARFRGELFEGLDLPNCYRYHEWFITERERARRRRLAVLDELVSRYEPEAPEDALRFARERVGVDPLTESAHVVIVRLLGRLGRAREARAQYDTCKRILETELGARPSAELEATRMALTSALTPSVAAPERRIAPPAPVTAEASTEPVRSRAKLVARGAERSALVDAARHASASASGGAVLLLGDPGMGKSRLLEELADIVRTDGGSVLAGRAFEAERVRPYGPFIDAFRSAAVGAFLSERVPDLAVLLPELGGANTASGAAEDRNRLFDAVVRGLRALAERAPVLLVLDDVHWLDEASAALLHFAARALASSRVLLACGARPGELIDNPVAQRVMRSLGRERKLVEIPLAPLDLAEIVELVASVAKGVDAARIFEESEGNPMFALEIAEARARGGDALGTLDALLGERLERLEPKAAALLPWMAALGRSFRLDVLERVTALSTLDLVAAIDELERRSVVRAAATGTSAGYDFSHDLLRNAAYDRISEPRRAFIHSRIARALDPLRSKDGALAGDVAHHAALAGENELCIRASVAAGQRCLRLFANAEATSFAALGLRHVEGLPLDVRIPFEIALYVIDVHAMTWRHRARELEAAFSRAILVAEEAGFHAEASVGFHALSELHWAEGDDVGAHESSVRALAASRATDLPTAVTIGQTGRCLAQLEREIPRARALLEEAAALIAGSGVEVPGTTLGLGIVHWFEGDVARGTEFIERALVQALRAKDHWIECECLTRLGHIALFLREPELALRRAHELLPIAKKMGHGSEEPVALSLVALAERMLRRPGAREAVRDAAVRLRAIDAKGHLSYVLTMGATLDLEDGDLESAREQAAEAVAAAEAISRRSAVCRARAALGRTLFASGKRDEAISVLHGISDDPASLGTLPADARAALCAAAMELGAPLSTTLPTAATSDAAQALLRRSETPAFSDKGT